MDRVTTGLGAPDAMLPPGFDFSQPGPLDRQTAIAILSEGDRLLEADEPSEALARYARVRDVPDRDLAAAALFGVGNALYRLDRDGEALVAWQRATQFGETPVTYRAWRQVAAALVRAGDLRGALDAYRECERRAPREDRGEIASRLGWLSKETGNTRAAGRYFARSRGDALAPFVTYLIIALTVIVSFTADSSSPQGVQLLGYLELNKQAIAHGEYYRLFSVTLVHGGLLHLIMNMYALFIVGVLVEKMYGWALTLAFYLLGAAAASTASYVFGGPIPSVGASGAIFCLFGVVFAALRAHHPVLDSQSRGIAAQIGFLIVINIAFGFSGFMNIDNSAHIGGLLAGLWLGLLFPPGQVATLAAFWQGTEKRPSSQALLMRAGGVVALVAVVVFGLAMGPQTIF